MPGQDALAPENVWKFNKRKNFSIGCSETSDLCLKDAAIASLQAMVQEGIFILATEITEVLNLFSSSGWSNGLY
jgi:hypothetical protein